MTDEAAKPAGPNADQGERWSGRLGFILATVGSAVGIGSIWKFPYEVGANGGGAFVLVYLLGIVLIVLPLMFAEFAIGRRGGGDPVTSIETVARAQGLSSAWRWLGAMGVLSGFLILSYYCVIGGWTLAYAWETALAGLPGSDAAAVQARYDALMRSPLRMLLYDAVFIALAVAVVARGVMGGIEAAAKVLMPLLALLMVLLAGYAVVEGDVTATLRFLLIPDWSRFSAQGALSALGLGFFSIGVGMGLMIAYAAYSDARMDLRQIAVASVAADTAISLLAGFAVFPIVFAHGLNAAAGPGLVFVTLPLAFADLPGGRWAAVAFFLLLFVAAMGSAIATFELTVTPFVRRFGWPRHRAAWTAGLACLVAGVPTVLSFSLWAHWHPLQWLPALADATFFELLDQLTSNLLLPLGGFALALLAGWWLPAVVFADELGLGARGSRRLRLMLRYGVPAGVALASLAPLFG